MFRKGIHLLTASIIVLGMLAVFSWQQPTSADFSPQQLATPTPRLEYDSLTNYINEPACIAPCWAGLYLAESEIKDISDWYFVLGKKEPPMVEDGEFSYVGLSIDGNSYMSLWVSNSKDKLTAMGIQSGDLLHSTINWNRYLPGELMTEYGLPDEVTLSPGSGYDRIYLKIRYENIGLYGSFRYEVPLQSTALPLILCNDKLEWFRLWLESTPIEFSPYMEYSLWQAIRYPQELEEDIEQLFLYNLDNLPEMLSQPNGCFLLPAFDNWNFENSD